MSDIVERLRAYIMPSGNIKQEAADTIEALRAENAQKRDALIGTLAALVAAVSLLEHGGKKAMPSDKMFEQMIADFKSTIRAARKAMGETE